MAYRLVANNMVKYFSLLSGYVYLGPRETLKVSEYLPDLLICLLSTAMCCAPIRYRAVRMYVLDL